MGGSRKEKMVVGEEEEEGGTKRRENGRKEELSPWLRPVSGMGELSLGTCSPVLRGGTKQGDNQMDIRQELVSLRIYHAIHSLMRLKRGVLLMMPLVGNPGQTGHPSLSQTVHIKWKTYASWFKPHYNPIILLSFPFYRNNEEQRGKVSCPQSHSR